MPPTTALERELAAIWQDLLQLPQVSVHDNFFEIGGDSISVMRLFELMETRLGRALPLTTFLQGPTIFLLAQQLYAVDGDRLAGIVVPVQEKGARPPFFWMHGVFGDFLSILNVAPHMDSDQPIYGLRAIGLLPGSDPDQEIETMAARYVEAIRHVQPAGPYHLGGFCFGGVLAYEVARQLEEAGERAGLLAIVEGSAPRAFHRPLPLLHPQRLQVAAQSAPHWAHTYKDTGARELAQGALRIIGRSDGSRRLANGEDQQVVEMDNMADFGASRPEIQHRLRQIHYEAIDAYVPQPYGGSITLFRARAVRPRQMLFAEFDPLRGWGTLAGGRVQVRYVDGAHTTILHNPFAGDLAAQLNDALRSAMAAPGTTGK